MPFQPQKIARPLFDIKGFGTLQDTTLQLAISQFRSPNGRIDPRTHTAQGLDMWNFIP
jgi:hypothetical protein